MQQEIRVRELAEQFFKEEIKKLDDPQRKEEIELEEETYIGVWMLGFRAGEQHPGTTIWVKGAPKELKQHFARVPSVIEDDTIYEAVIWPIEGCEHWWCIGYGFKFSVHRDKIIEHLDESPSKEGNKDRGLEAFAKYLDEQRNSVTPDMWAEKAVWSKPNAFQEWLQYFNHQNRNNVND